MSSVGTREREDKGTTWSQVPKVLLAVGTREREDRGITWSQGPIVLLAVGTREREDRKDLGPSSLSSVET